jgi:hypothetical protein
MAAKPFSYYSPKTKVKTRSRVALKAGMNLVAIDPAVVTTFSPASGHTPVHHSECDLLFCGCKIWEGVAGAEIARE